MAIILFPAVSVVCADAQIPHYENVAAYGAACNWSGTSGTDDTAAFQAAAAAANKTYAATGQPVKIYFSGNCLVNGLVSYGSGVWWEGLGGTITVSSQTGYTFQAVNADDVGWDNMVINVLLPSSSTKTIFSVINWMENAQDSIVHHGVFIRNNVIRNSTYGILVIYAVSPPAAGSLTDVNISGNTVDSPTPFSNADGIHIDGNVNTITIANNRVSNRGDGAISLTAEAASVNPLDVPRSFTIVGNTLTQDRVGIDISGAQYGTVTGNTVAATGYQQIVGGPALRIIYYYGASSNITVTGNYFQVGSLTQNGEAFVDINDSYVSGQTPPDCNCVIAGNTFAASTPSFSIKANRVSFIGNTILPGGHVLVDYNAGANMPTQNVMIGTNNWLGDGTLTVGRNGSLSVNIQVAPQNVAGNLIKNDLSSSILPNGYSQTMTVPGCSFRAQANGNVCHQTVTMPQMHTSTAYSVNCSVSTNLTGTGGAAPTLSWTANIDSASQFDLYEQSVTATSAWTTYPNYQVEATCTTVHP
jgi:hypothetical protein